jgi:hypothetical protein
MAPSGIFSCGYRLGITFEQLCSYPQTRLTFQSYSFLTDYLQVSETQA